MVDHDKEKERPAAPAAGNGAPAESAPDQGAEAAPESEAPVDEVATLRAELDETKDRLLREHAELENYKKRTARERAEALRYGSETLLRELLPVIDNLERATEQLRAHEGSAPGGDAVVEGLEMVRRGLVELLERHGVKAVEAHGTTFDPAFHEAIGHVESEHPANTVIDEHQRGYSFHDRLLRPALVTVGKGPGEQNPAPDAVEKPQDDG